MPATNRTARRAVKDKSEELLRLPLTGDAQRLIAHYNAYMDEAYKARRRPSNRENATKARAQYARQALKVARRIASAAEKNGGLLRVEDLSAIGVLQYCHHQHGQRRALASELHEKSVLLTIFGLLAAAGLETAPRKDLLAYSTLRSKRATSARR